MVTDPCFQYTATWSYSGTSIIVCNTIVFSDKVLPKHFKHNNFSSFIRQLNMYGFHKINKSPRGCPKENQIWEISHESFQRDKPYLLKYIKRKTTE
ncbi:HSF-type DNA-binding-domain-containing protein, partial [Sporodiniella umbellata]